MGDAVSAANANDRQEYVITSELARIVFKGHLIVIIVFGRNTRQRQRLVCTNNSAVFCILFIRRVINCEKEYISVNDAQRALFSRIMATKKSIFSLIAYFLIEICSSTNNSH